ncbi:MAG: STAS domain-containing protein [Burkholderiales bacterium]|nr:STAS domain-containing protein [Burkholderiales bacterium]
MDIESESLGDKTVRIILTGRMDVQGAQEIDARFNAMTAIDGGRCLVDMAGVSFLASIGIRTLLISAKALKARGGRLVLVNPDANVTKVLQTSGVDTLIPVYGELRAALAAVSTP